MNRKHFSKWSELRYTIVEFVIRRTIAFRVCSIRKLKHVIFKWLILDLMRISCFNSQHNCTKNITSVRSTADSSHVALPVFATSPVIPRLPHTRFPFSAVFGLVHGTVSAWKPRESEGWFTSIRKRNFINETKVFSESYYLIGDMFKL